jgi:16S rRNA (uracil1498-N3)-methyltransferase
VTAPVFLADLTAAATGTTLRLDGAEGRHAAAVRRLAAGERVDLTDGAGGFAECVVAVADRDSLQLEVLVRKDFPAPVLSLTVVQALPKGDRGELAVDLLTEVGVDEIVPWAASRCVTQWRGDRGDKALAKWRAHAREAGKQSRRPWFPDVTAAASTRDVAVLLGAASAGYVLHESATTSLAAQEIPYEGSVVLVVGPEGGISDEELAIFTAAGALVTRMGPTVMRTSTAGVAAAAAVLVRTGRWS